MDLDLLDRKILLALDENGRASLKAIAKKSRTSPEVVRYRLARLQENGVIRRFMALVNFSEFGHVGYGVFCTLSGQKGGEQLQKALQNRPKVYWIAEFGGRFDLAFAIAAKDPYEFYGIFNEIKEKSSGAAGDWKVAVRIRLVQFPRTYLLAQPVRESASAPYFGRKIRHKRLSNADFRILKAISQDARIEIAEISEALSIPQSTVAFRLQKLNKEGILQGVSPQVCCESYGFQCYQLFLHISDLNDEKRKALFSYCQSNPNVIFMIETLGDWNFELIYEVKSQKEFQSQVKRLRGAFPSVSAMETAIIFDHNLKYDLVSFSENPDEKI